MSSCRETNAKTELLKLVEKLMKGDRGAIVSTSTLDRMEIAFAGAEDRMVVLPDGTGWVYVPRWR